MLRRQFSANQRRQGVTEVMRPGQRHRPLAARRCAAEQMHTGAAKVMHMQGALRKALAPPFTERTRTGLHSGRMATLKSRTRYAISSGRSAQVQQNGCTRVQQK